MKKKKKKVREELTNSTNTCVAYGVLCKKIRTEKALSTSRVDTASAVLTNKANLPLSAKAFKLQQTRYLTRVLESDQQLESKSRKESTKSKRNTAR